MPQFPYLLAATVPVSSCLSPRAKPANLWRDWIAARPTAPIVAPITPFLPPILPRDTPTQTAYGSCSPGKLPRLFSPSELSQNLWTHPS